MSKFQLPSFKCLGVGTVQIIWSMRIIYQVIECHKLSLNSLDYIEKYLNLHNFIWQDLKILHVSLYGLVEVWGRVSGGGRIGVFVDMTCPPHKAHRQSILAKPGNERVIN